ncbi:MAG: hypothetical protein WBA22_00745 [Candidatus Methanofastidiosia archaeon]
MTMISHVNNLDKKCFSCSLEIVKALNNVKEAERKKKAKELFNFITKSLGILQEDGVFAFYVYLKSEKDEKSNTINAIEEETVNLLKESINDQLNASLEKIQLLAEDINTLLLAKSLIEKTLIYARYQVKSESD